MGRFFLIVSLALSFILVGCPATISSTAYQEASEASSQKKEAMSASSLGPGDVFEIRVYREKEISGSYRMSPEGEIDFPLIGIVRVVGFTPNQIADEIRSRLAQEFIRRPHVTVYVHEYNSKKVFVMGEVHKPGTFSFQDNMTVVQAITMAGGFTDTAVKDGTIVTRIIEGEEKRIAVPVDRISGGFARNFQLTPGDIIFVPESVL